MIEPMELTEGWYRARPLTAEGIGAWCFVCVKGEAPFLEVWPVIMNVTSSEWWSDERAFGRRNIDRATKWEFGSRIEIPQEVLQ